MFAKKGNSEAYEAVKAYHLSEDFDRQRRTDNLDRTETMTVWGDMRYYEE